MRGGKRTGMDLELRGRGGGGGNDKSTVRKAKEGSRRDRQVRHRQRHRDKCTETLIPIKIEKQIER